MSDHAWGVVTPVDHKDIVYELIVNVMAAFKIFKPQPRKPTKNNAMLKTTSPKNA